MKSKSNIFLIFYLFLFCISLPGLATPSFAQGTCDDQNLGNLSDPGYPASATRTATHDPAHLAYDSFNFDVFQRQMHNRPVTVAIAKNYPMDATDRVSFANFILDTWGILWNEYGGFAYPSFTYLLVTDYDAGIYGDGFRSTQSRRAWQTHEIAHLWANMTGSYGSMWFMEGSATYYGSIRQNGESPFESFIQSFYNTYSSCVHTGRDRPIADQGQWKGYGIDYDHTFIAQKGALVLYLLDREMRATGHHIGELGRVIFQRHMVYENSGTYTNADLLNIVNQVTGQDFTDFFNNFVHGTVKLPLENGMPWVCHTIAPGDCTYSVTPMKGTFGTTGGTGATTVTAGSGCSWTAHSHDAWITITSASGDTGSGSVTYTVSPNSSGVARTGILTVAGRTFTVKQEGTQACQYTIYPTDSLPCGRELRYGVLSIVAPEDCPWAASSNVSWITIDHVTANSGNGSVIFTIAAKNPGSSRTGAISVAGKSMTITQSDECRIELSHQGVTENAEGYIYGTVTVWSSYDWWSTIQSCTWPIVSNASWIHVSQSTITGNGWVYYSYDQNTSTAPRTGTITIGGQTFTVTQWGWGPTPPDFNRDGKNDILVRNLSTGGISVWYMNGTTVSSQQTFATSRDINWKIIGMADFNLDGQTDILWRHQLTGEIGAWLMDGIAVRQNVAVATVSDNTWKIVGIGDFNSDGKPDLFWQNQVSGVIAVWYMNGAALVSTAVVTTVSDTHWKIVGAGDFNGDGKPDLIWKNDASGVTAAWIMDGIRLASTAVIGTQADLNWKVVYIGDLSGDGKPDILWGHALNGNLYAWVMNGTAISQEQYISALGGTSWIGGAGEDRGAAAVAPSISSHPAGTTIQAGQSATLSVTAAGTSPMSYQWYQGSSGDTSNPLGTNTSSYTTPSLTQARSYWVRVTNEAGSADSNTATVTVTAGPSQPFDFNSDGRTDFLWRNKVTGEVFLWYMDGANYLQTQSIAVVGDMSWQIIGAADFNSDGKPDLLWRNTATGMIALWYMNGAALASTASIMAIPMEWVIVATADFNGDGKPDFLWRNTATGMIALWYMNGAALASTASIMAIPMEWVIVATADFNGDGKPDFLWRNASTGMLAVWYMNGATLVSAVSVTTVSTDEEIAGTADMNGDGNPDIIWRNKNTGTISVWYMNGATYLSNGVIATADTGWTLIAPR